MKYPHLRAALYKMLIWAGIAVALGAAVAMLVALLTMMQKKYAPEQNHGAYLKEWLGYHMKLAGGGNGRASIPKVGVDGKPNSGSTAARHKKNACSRECDKTHQQGILDKVLAVVPTPKSINCRQHVSQYAARRSAVQDSQTWAVTVLSKVKRGEGEQCFH